MGRTKCVYVSFPATVYNDHNIILWSTVLTTKMYVYRTKNTTSCGSKDRDDFGIFEKAFSANIYIFFIVRFPAFSLARHDYCTYIVIDLARIPCLFNVSGAAIASESRTCRRVPARPECTANRYGGDVFASYHGSNGSDPKVGGRILPTMIAAPSHTLNGTYRISYVYITYFIT